MITTFEDIYTEVQSATSSESASELIHIKRDANVATQRFKSVMKRPWSRIAKKANSVADQQDYQLPRSVLRISGVSYLSGSTYYPLEEISSEHEWNILNSMSGTGDPTYFFPKGKDTISLYPIPGTAITKGIRVYYEPKQPRMVTDNYDTGTVTATNGSTTITHSATGFTSSMVGHYFYVTDGTDGYEYQIVEYTSTSKLVLENVFEGITGAGKTFVIGPTPDIPDEYQTSIVDYCIGRSYLRGGDTKNGTTFLALFDKALEECKDTYGTPTSNQQTSSPMQEYINQLDIPPRKIT